MVQVATPDWCHVEHCEQALAAGRHVLVQKPPCIDRAGLERLWSLSHRAGPRLKVLLNTRQTRLCRTLKALLDAGAIGRLVQVRIASRGRRFPIPDISSPYLTAALGGVWIHNGLHWLDEACFYAEALPTAVHVVATRNDNGPPQVLGEGPNYWCGRFELGADTSFTLDVNTMLMRDGLPGGMQRVLIGTEGELRQLYGESGLVLHRRGLTQPERPPLLDPDLTPAEDTLESFRRAIDAFADEIRTELEQPPTRHATLHCMDALLRGAESAQSCRRLTVAAAG